MREMRKNIAVIETSHSDFRNNHLKERRESGENTKLVRCKSKTGSCRKIASFHDTGRDEHFRMILVDDLQTGRTLEITLNNIKAYKSDEGI
jgi:uncharacterized protein YxeA